MTQINSHAQKLRLGTRASKLARWQADWVRARLEELGCAVEIVEIATRGDLDVEIGIGSLSAVGVFTKEIQRSLLTGEIDLAVHSLKDLPTDVVPGLTLGAIPARESPLDVLVSRGPLQLMALPAGARIGTGSLRRQAQLRHVRPDLHVEGIRGNVDTRLQKLDEGQFDAIVLAEAGLRRLGLTGRITEVLPPEVMLPAVGQGALGIECRSDDAGVLGAIGQLDDASTRSAVAAERSLLAALRGGCLAPVGAWGRIERGQLCLSGAVLSSDGTTRIEAHAASAPSDAAPLGRQVAASLLAQGATDLISASRTR